MPRFIVIAGPLPDHYRSNAKGYCPSCHDCYVWKPSPKHGLRYTGCPRCPRHPGLRTTTWQRKTTWRAYPGRPLLDSRASTHPAKLKEMSQ